MGELSSTSCGQAGSASRSRCRRWFSYFNDDPQNIRNIAEYGGGALRDIGCY